MNYKRIVIREFGPWERPFWRLDQINRPAAGARSIKRIQ